MKRNLELEATVVEKHSEIDAFWMNAGVVYCIWAATETRAIGM